MGRRAESVALRTHVLALLTEMDLRYQQRFDAQMTAINAATMSADKRFELLNELRSGVALRSDYDAQEKIISLMQSRLDRMESHGRGLRDGWGYLVGGVGILVAVASLILTR